MKQKFITIQNYSFRYLREGAIFILLPSLRTPNSSIKTGDYSVFILYIGQRIEL